MPRDVVVLFVHGINTTCQNYYEPLRDLIVKKLSRNRKTKVAENVIFRAVFWADIVRGRQQEYIHYAKQLGQLKPHALHTMVLEGLGDAAAYQKTERQQNSAYHDIQRRVHTALADVTTPGEDARPLIVIAHSLGCHVISSFAWDLFKLKNHEAFEVLGKMSDDQADFDRATEERGPKSVQLDAVTQRFIKSLPKRTALQRLDTLAGIVTVGNNMPLFTFVHGPQHVVPVFCVPKKVACQPAFPGVALTPAVSALAKWINIYSENDPLGYPLKPLNDAYDNEPRLQDIVTRSEWHAPRNWREWLKLHAFNLFCIREGFALSAHVGYWHDPKVAAEAVVYQFEI